VEFSGERPLDQEKESEWVFHREMPWLPKQYRDSGSHSLKFYQHLHGMREINDGISPFEPVSRYCTVILTVVETHTSKLTGAKQNRMSEILNVPSLSQGTKRYEKPCVRKRVPGYEST